MNCPYSMIIQWSDENDAYVVTLPEFGGCMTHGDTYEEAAKQGRDAIASLIDAYRAESKKLPKPHAFRSGDSQPVAKRKVSSKAKAADVKERSRVNRNRTAASTR